jgi:hypothetical protein
MSESIESTTHELRTYKSLADRTRPASRARDEE